MATDSSHASERRQWRSGRWHDAAKQESPVLVIGGARYIRDSEEAAEGAIPLQIAAAALRGVAITTPKQGFSLTQCIQ